MKYLKLILDKYEFSFYSLLELWIYHAFFPHNFILLILRKLSFPSKNMETFFFFIFLLKLFISVLALKCLLFGMNNQEFMVKQNRYKLL